MPAWPRPASRGSPWRPSRSATPTSSCARPLPTPRLGLVPRNAAAVAKPPVARREPRRTWSSEDVKDFFAVVAGERLFAAYVLLATTGMRRREVLGLRWCDVDLDAGELTVVHTITTLGYTPVVSTPKTNRSRRVVYPA